MNRRNSLKSVALMVLGGAAGKRLVAAQAKETNLYDTSLDFVWATFKNRRSVRNFKPDPVPAEHLTTILDMARTAPTSGNQQPWKFLVIQDAKKIAALKDTHVQRRLDKLTKEGGLTGEKLEHEKKTIAQSFDGYFSAPVYIVILTDNNSMYPSYNQHDGPLAAGYLMLAARFLGYGTLYATDSFNPELMRKALVIPDRYQIVCCTPLGIPERWPEAPHKKDLSEFIVREHF